MNCYWKVAILEPKEEPALGQNLNHKKIEEIKKLGPLDGLTELLNKATLNKAYHISRLKIS